MILNIAFTCLIAAIILAIVRLLRGPSWGDRIAALDFLNAALAVLVVVIVIKTSFVSLLDIALLISFLGFLGTVALARFLVGGRVIE